MKKLFAPTVCPSVETLLLYSQQKLSKADLRAVEEHLADCEICSDFVEGLTMLKNHEQFEADVHELNQRVEEKVGSSKTKKITVSAIFRYAIAASVTLLLALAFLFTFLKKESKNEVTVIENTQELDSSFEESIDSNQNIENRPTDNRQQQQLEKVPSLASSENRRKASPLVIASSSSESEKSTDANLTSGKAVFTEPRVGVSGSDQVSADITAIATTADAVMEQKDRAEATYSSQSAPAAATAKEYIAPSKESKKIEPSKASTASTKRSASNESDDSDKANYYSIKAKLLELIAREPKNEEAILQLAKVERVQKEYGNSNEQLNRLISSKNSSYREEAEWLKALNLVDEKKKQEAKIQLKKIAESKGKYAYAAAELMAEQE